MITEKNKKANKETISEEFPCQSHSFHIIKKFISLFFIFEVGLVTYICLFLMSLPLIVAKYRIKNYSYTIRKENI